MAVEFKVGNRVITEDGPPFVIAEIGSNHGGNLATCLEMINVAKLSGADAVKMQLRNNKELFTKEFYNSPYVGDASFGPTYGKHREALDFGATEFRIIKKVCDDIGMIFFATPFEEDSLRFLVKLGCPLLKVASCDLNNTPFIKQMAQTRLPIIISSGGASYDDIDWAIDALPENYPYALLHTISTYPNKDYELNLFSIYHMRKRYPKIIGFSTHHPGILPLYIAYMLGARIFECHITLNRANKGTDNSFSLEPQGLAKLITDLKRIPVMLGSGDKKILDSEKGGFIYKMGKAVHITKPIKKGDMLTEKNIGLKAPAHGPPPYEIDQYLHKIALFDLSTSDVLKPEMVETINTEEGNE